MREGVSGDGEEARFVAQPRIIENDTPPSNLWFHRMQLCTGHGMPCPFYNGVGSVKGHDGWGELEGSSGFLPQDLFLRC